MLDSRGQVQITDTYYSPAVNICAVIFIVPTVLGVGGRIFTKKAFVRKVNEDDYVILAALVFSLAQIATVFVATDHGLGQQWENISVSQKVVLQKSTYASGILLIFSLVLTKLSVISFMQSLSPSTINLRSGYAIAAFLALWGVVSVFVSAFQCSLPNPYDVYYGKCLDVYGFWMSFSILNIISDIILIAWPALIILKVRTGLWRRIIIVMCFACRIFVIGAIAAQMCFLRDTRKSTDVSLDSWKLAIATQLMQCLSITTACIPYLRPFLDSLESGLLRSDDLRRRGMSGGGGYTGSGSHGSSQKHPSIPSKNGTRTGTSTDEVPLRPAGNAKSITQVHAEPNHAWDEESTSTRAEITLSTSWSVAEVGGLPKQVS
ncbi:hypothetical protein BGZ60DRAFT_530820 [Tricladium varicosporioides]|nr:hypothetical protein BGZ60DRAFT_530820 [Hymenoscyphus varicosporioides]